MDAKESTEEDIAESAKEETKSAVEEVESRMDDVEEEEESIVDVGDSKVDDDGESRPRAESLLARCLAVSRSISRVTSSVIPRYSKSSSFSCSMSSAVSYPLRTNTEVRFSKLMEESKSDTLCDLEILLVGLASIVR